MQLGFQLFSRMWGPGGDGCGIVLEEDAVTVKAVECGVRVLGMKASFVAAVRSWASEVSSLISQR